MKTFEQLIKIMEDFQEAPTEAGTLEFYDYDPDKGEFVVLEQHNYPLPLDFS